MRIYVCYHQEDQPYCVQIVDHLDFHQVRFDHGAEPTAQSVSDWLDWCQSVLFLVSKKSVNIKNCHGVLQKAQQLGKPVIQIILEPNLPTIEFLDPKLKICLSDGLGSDSIHELLTLLDDVQNSIQQSNEENIKESEVTTNKLINDAARAMEEGNYTHAVHCLSQILERDDKPKYINTELFLQEAQIALSQQKKQREMQKEYLQIVQLVQLPATRSVGLNAFAAFKKANPYYDPRNITALIEPLEEKETEQLTFLQYATDRTRKIPLLEWCEIPEGNININTKEGNQTFFVNDFLMARYPVTNKQYQAFVVASNGYCDPYWWEFSESAWTWRTQNPEPTESTFGGHDRPRENVNWYEAIAFCRWLSEMTKLEITLPTLHQRRRAIMGDDGREYPWGDTFDPSRCNTREQGLRLATTSVTRYKDGVSQHGVYDLAGNVWEWCLDRAPTETKDDGTVIEKAYVHGGSYMSPYDRCHVNSRSAPPILTAYAAIGFRVICTSAR